MRRLLIALMILLGSGIALGGEPAAEKAPPTEPTKKAADEAPKQDLVPWSAYRILARYDDRTMDRVRGWIREADEDAREEYELRRKYSREELEAMLDKARGSLDERRTAARRAEEQERAAKARRDRAEEERWRLLRIKEMQAAQEVERRVRVIGAALKAKSLDQLLLDREKEQTIAEKALERLQAIQRAAEAAKKAELKQRGPARTPAAPAPSTPAPDTEQPAAQTGR